MSVSYGYTIEIKVKASIKSYLPSLFRVLRMQYGIYENELIQSIDPKNNLEQIFKSN